MKEDNHFYFKQLLSGIDVAKNDHSALQMANFIYLIGDQKTRQCVVVDPAYDIDDILNITQSDNMELVGALVTHYHPDHVGGSIFGMNIRGLPDLMEKKPVPVYVNKHEADGVKQVTGISDNDMKLMDGEDIVKVGAVEISCFDYHQK